MQLTLNDDPFLDQATYRLADLPRSTRLPLKRLAATIGEGLR